MLSGLQQKEHVLNRLGYGPSRWHSARYDRLGSAGFVAEQLNDGLPEIEHNGTTISAKIDRSVLSRRQLAASLIDFWFNHFNVDTGSLDPVEVMRSLAGRKVRHHQNTAVAPHVLGRFADMLIATAMSPSMLDYLDNRYNFADVVLNDKRYGPNENYGRELLELHTVGVHGGYTEDDVVDAARVMTGWSTRSDLFLYKDRLHDEGGKVVLGRSFPPGRGMEEGEELLTFLAEHHSTAAFVTGKLVDRFVDESRPASVHAAAIQAYRSSGADLRAVMTAIFAHPDFVDEAHFRSKAKPPHRYVASALLAMGVRARDQIGPLRRFLVNQVVEAGELPYVVGPPTGYPDRSPFWVSGTSMVARFETAERIAYDDGLRRLLKSRAGVNGADMIETITKVAAVMVPGGLSVPTRIAILDHVAANASTNNGRVSAVAHVILCSPEFARF